MEECFEFDKAVEEHRKMWKWIAIQSMKEKRRVSKKEYFIKNNLEYISSRCFCCNYVREVNYFLSCEECPIIWPFGNCQGEATDVGLYRKWCEENDYKESAIIAYKISKLPERGKTENDY